jgi:hypothetical protein
MVWLAIVMNDRYGTNGWISQTRASSENFIAQEYKRSDKIQSIQIMDSP